MNSLVAPLFPGPIDVVGDVHGEIEALLALMKNMGYDENGFHPENRKIVFVGDLCDRGPDSPAVIKLVKKLIDNGNAQAIIGNHEINLLQLKPKDGSGWYFKERFDSDKAYKPFQEVSPQDSQLIYDFLANLPVALERSDLRIVHAAWDSERINVAKTVPLGQTPEFYNNWEIKCNEHISTSGLLQRYREEQKEWAVKEADPKTVMPFLQDTCDYNLAHQMMNPLRVLTSGMERQCPEPFYAGGKWRFVTRFAWWDEYNEEPAVIVGHYWRQIENNTAPQHHATPSLFNDIESTSWHGKLGNVFCVDYSVGGRFKERNKNTPLGVSTKLAALRWPENELVLDTKEVIPTTGYRSTKTLKNKF